MTNLAGALGVSSSPLGAERKFVNRVGRHFEENLIVPPICYRLSAAAPRRELSQPSRAVASYRKRRELSQPSRTVASYRNRRELRRDALTRKFFCCGGRQL